MLRSYEAIYEDGQVKWVTEKPEVKFARVIVTILDENETESPKQRRMAPEAIAGKGKTLGDLVSPIVDAGDWECLK
jgi:hypothetical protein